jgi:hypothetical protein
MPLNISQINALKKEIPIWVNSMRAAGYTEQQIKLSLPQTALETGYFLSKVYKENLNPAGIKYKPNNPAPDSTKGGVSERGDNYAKFNSRAAAAKEHLRIISMLRKNNVLGIPANAKNFFDFANRLFANGYYEGYPKNATDSQKIINYTNGMVQANKYILEHIPDYLDQKKKINPLIYGLLIPVIYFLFVQK